MPAALEVRGLTKTFGGLRAVDDVSFAVQPGEIYGFIGPNGAGKTTTMRIIATLAMPDGGDVLVEGWSVLDEPRRVRERLGFMPDAYGAYTATTVLEYLDFFARAYGLKGDARRRTLRDVMEFTALEPLTAKLTTALSKGMKQRLCLAKTLLHDPSVLVLDEPASGLDPRARIELRELVKALAESGKAILVSSHILSELSEICDGVAIIEAGRIQASGRVADIVRGIRAHREIFVRCLAGPDATQLALAELPGVGAARHERNGVAFEFTADDAALADLLARLVAAGLRPVELAAQETDLEDVFLSLTVGKVQ